MKILIVEKDASLLETLRDVCHDEGFEAITTSDCEEAFRVVNSGNIPDVIVCDQIIPGNSGIRFRDKLQLNMLWKNIPFVLMLGQRNEIMSSHDLLKPFSIEDFLKTIKEVRPS